MPEESCQTCFVFVAREGPRRAGELDSREEVRTQHAKRGAAAAQSACAAELLLSCHTCQENDNQTELS